WSLSDLCSNGPEEALTATDKAQPALYATSFALWTALSAELAVRPAGAAGHSLGEFTAHAAAGSFSYESGLRLVATRGAAMARAAVVEPSGMAAVIGADEDLARQIALDRRNDGGRLWVANLNAPGQIVFSGAQADIDWLVAESKDLGVRRVIPLKVAGAFHSPYMQPARDELADALEGVSWSEPEFDVWANVAAKPTTNPREDVLDQLTGTVRFSETLSNMASDGIEAFVHVGPGDVTLGMAKRAAPGCATLAVSTLDDVVAVAQELSVP
ncbi:MAG: ACP S-malonyltransferase, partial [Acidimicrobiia bacterium]|nr:ACP S-malonyltransferase [Acidimicrobiia bacterium]